MYKIDVIHKLLLITVTDNLISLAFNKVNNIYIIYV